MRKARPALYVAVLAVAAPAHANLVANGSFETASFSGSKSYFDQGNVLGWSGGTRLTFIDKPGSAADGSYLSVYGPFPSTSPDGGNFVEGNGDSRYSGAIYQTLVGLKVGQDYTVSFYQAAGQQQGFDGPTTEAWGVWFGDTYQRSSTMSLAAHGVGQWQAQSMTFTAASAQQVLSFMAMGTPSGAPPISFLDGVSVVASAQISPHAVAVPEPASLAMLTTGVFGLGVARKRRSRT